MSKIILLFASLSFLFVLSGCQTVKNTAVGLAGIGKGIADDTYNTYQGIKKADNWFEEHYW